MGQRSHRKAENVAGTVAYLKRPSGKFPSVLPLGPEASPANCVQETQHKVLKKKKKNTRKETPSNTFKRTACPQRAQQQVGRECL